MSRLDRGAPAALALAAVVAFLLAPLAAAQEAPFTLTHPIHTTYLVSGCQSIHTERFDLPEGAFVTDARLHATLDVANTTGLGATVEVRAGATLLALSDSSSGLGWLGANGSLDVRALNALLLNASAEGGFVLLNLSVSACPTLDLLVAAVTLDEAVLTYLPPSPNGSTNGSTLPPLVGVSFDGSMATSVESGEPLALAALVNGSLPAGTQVSWFVDGKLVGHGATLENVSFAPGLHNVSVRASDGTSVSTYSMTLNALARPPPTPGFDLPLVAGVVGLAAVGAALAGTQAGRWLILGVALGSVFARLNRASLLDHFVRGTLYQVIRENPGIHFAELRRRAQVANGAASHHLRMLEKGGYLKVVIDGTKTKFYTTDRPLDAEVYGISDTEKAILEAVTGFPGIGQHDLAAKLSRSHSAVSRAVTRLVSMGYITTTREGARVRLFPREAGEVATALAPWPDQDA